MPYFVTEPDRECKYTEGIEVWPADCLPKAA